MLRDLAYLFLEPRRQLGLSTLARMVIPVYLLAIVFSTRGPCLRDALLVGAVLATELGIIAYLRGVRRLVNALGLVLLVTLAGVFIQILAPFIGFTSPPVPTLVFGSARLVSVFLGFTLFFQLLSLREWRSIFWRLGFDKQALILSMIAIHLPTTIMYFSEAYTTVRLKHGARRLVSIIAPLAYISVMNSKTLVESYLLYKPSLKGEIVLYKPRDVIVYSIIVSSLILLLKLSF